MRDKSSSVSLLSSLFAASFLLFAGSAAIAGLIPAERTYPWKPHVNVGVGGGIPTNRTVYTTLSLTNNEDLTTKLSTALSSCPAGQVVLIPEGTFKGSLFYQTGAGKTVRGAGMGKTIIRNYSQNGQGAFSIGTSDWPEPSPSLPIISGATNGSTTVTVTNTSNISPGRMIRITQNNPNYVFSTGGYQNQMGVMALVASKTSTTVTFSPALPVDFTNSPALGSYQNYLMSGFGFEDFTVDLTNSAVAGFWMEQVYGCWIKGVEIRGTTTRQIKLYNAMKCEIRDCYIHDARSSGPGHEGIDLMQNVCWSLIENNICDRGGFPMIILGDGSGSCVGNVIAYNYLVNLDSGSGVAGGSLSLNHGPHNMFNLVEGNVAQMFQSDGYYGSASDNTAYRNWFTGVYPSGAQWPIAVNLGRWSYRFNLYGNVLGSNGYTASYESEVNGYSDSLKLIYRLGYPNMGNPYYGTGLISPPSKSRDALDLNVKATLLRTNNYDYATGAIDNAYDGEMPASLIYDSAPSWWGTNRWPAIDPQATPVISRIPAQNRYLAIFSGVRSSKPPAPSNIKLTPEAR